LAHTTAGKIFYGGGDLAIGGFLLANAASLGGPAHAIGMFFLLRGILTLIGISA
jgi:hypothetical protein